MITFAEKQRIMAKFPEYQLLTGMEDAAFIKGNGAVNALTAADVLAAQAMGFGRKDIFFTVPNKDNINAVLGKCRLVANSMEELQLINEAAKKYEAENDDLIMVGLRLIPDEYNDGSCTGIPMKQLSGMVHDIKQLKSISVCGSVITGDIQNLHGKDLGRFFRSCYQTAKMMTVILPCSMPYICAESCMEVIARNEAEHPETLDEFLNPANIVGMQNSTAFYADFLIQ